MYQCKHSTEMLMHVRWCEHAHMTILEDPSDPQELFLLNECADIPVGSIIRKCLVGASQFGAGLFSRYVLHQFTMSIEVKLQLPLGS